MKKRFNRENVLAEIRGRILYAREDYRRSTGKAHDPSDGWAQVPDDNSAANRFYGEIIALKRLLEELES